MAVIMWLGVNPFIISPQFLIKPLILSCFRFRKSGIGFRTFRIAFVKSGIGFRRFRMAFVKSRIGLLTFRVAFVKSRIRL